MPIADTQVVYSTDCGSFKPVSSGRTVLMANSHAEPKKQLPSSTTAAVWKNLFARLRFQMFCCHFRSDGKSLDGSYNHLEKEIDRSNSSNSRHATIVSWKAAMWLSVAVALIAAIRAKPVYEYYEDRTPEWTWDRNVYLTRGGGSGEGNEGPETSSSRTALIAQVTESLAMKRFSEVAARPNRAYARQWNMDYVQYYAGRVSYSSKSCFDKAFVLKTLAEKQNEDGMDAPTLWPHSLRVQYDAILLLPSDAIVMDMDENIIDVLLPNDKLAAIAGWTSSLGKLASNSGVVLFNLRHRHTMNVINLWWNMSQEVYQTCGAENGISTLIDAVAAVVDHNEGEILDDLIESIHEHPNGALSNKIIKCLPNSVPGSRSELFLSSLQQSCEIIHQTADSTCYRFYPKCEVVP
ncbi:hypothetical protein IV203_036350 [Nitzschia inconspicua]|uniref:Uncharacterized protein n=1 Tax=Nitzschia inconspicua TaxID=303405 RepID=A0A9K3LEZ9_9STRA|nr:hypothetical protein IV203_036350 [Nitzschia inconspicua]